MKTISDYIKLMEDSAVAVNTVSSGSIAGKDVPLQAIYKRKKPVAESDMVNSEVHDTVGKDPMATIYAPNPAQVDSEEGVTDKDADEKEKHKFKQKQNYQNDQVISYD